MAAGPVGTVWATGVWADTVWESGVWGDAIASYPLFTDGVYFILNLGGGMAYIKQLSPKVKANIATGHVENV